MAFTAGLILDVRGATGSDSNGGGFATTTTNMATDLAATSATGTTAVITSASYVFETRDEGHWAYIGGGTDWIKGFYQIVSTSGGAATLNTTAGAGYLAVGGVPYGVTTSNGCATTASPTGGTWSVDYSQGTSIAFTDLVIDGTTNTDATSSTKPLGKNFIGNLFNVTSGTGFTVQRVQLLSIPSGVIGRFDKSLGTLSSTGGNAACGGPLATPGLAGGLKIAGNTVFIQAATYTCSNSSNVAGGRVTDATTGLTATPNYWIGWNTIRTIQNVDSTKPTCNASANSVTVFTFSGTLIIVRNLKTGKSAAETSVTGMSMSATHSYVENCVATSITTGFTNGGINTTHVNCFADTCATGFNSTSTAGPSKYIGCTAKAFTTVGFTATDYSTLFAFCIAHGGTTTADGFSTSANGCVFLNCTSYGNAGDGWQFGSGFSLHTLINCVSTGNTGFQYHQVVPGETSTRLINCAGKNDGSGIHDLNASQLIGFTTLTVDPFANGAGGNFALNTTLGGGAELKGSGFPGVFPGISTTGYNDIGAAQGDSSFTAGGRRPTYLAGI